MGISRRISLRAKEATVDLNGELDELETNSSDRGPNIGAMMARVWESFGDSDINRRGAVVLMICMLITVFMHSPLAANVQDLDICVWSKDFAAKYSEQHPNKLPLQSSTCMEMSSVVDRLVNGVPSA